MSCLHPITAYYAKERNPSGKRSLVFDKRASHSGIKVEIACQQCIPCRIQRAAAGAIRCYHESKMHEVSSFVTLTYSDKNLPEDGGLVHRDFQLFMKRLRARSSFKMKMVMCGEYGERTNRPHYHALLFGCDFSDRRFFRKTGIGHNLDTSQFLEETWGLGHATVGDVTYESSRYVCGYVLKKVLGPSAADHYMGRRPDYIIWGNGIGKEWFQIYGSAAYNHDFIVVDGKRMKIPRYYDTKFEIVDTKRFEVVKRERVRKAKAREPDLANRRSWTREQVAKARLARFRRDTDET